MYTIHSASSAEKTFEPSQDNAARLSIFVAIIDPAYQKSVLRSFRRARFQVVHFTRTACTIWAYLKKLIRIVQTERVDEKYNRKVRRHNARADQFLFEKDIQSE